MTRTMLYEDVDAYVETQAQRIARECRERANAASDGLADYMLGNDAWRGEIRSAIRGMPQGLPGVCPARVIRDAVVGLGLMGLPPLVFWTRVAKRLLSQLGESGDGYRVRCHVVALEEPLGVYRAQGQHGQAWDGDWVKAEEEVPWWYQATEAMTLRGYSHGPLGTYAFVQRAGRPAVVVPVVRD